MKYQAIKVLLIEDSPGDARFIQAMIVDSLLGFRLEHVTRLGEALTEISKDPPDVILLDMTLPDSTGLNTLAEVRKAATRTPVVVITGLDDEEVGVQAVQEGAQDYLIKGQIDGNMVVRAINYAINRQRILNEGMERFALFDTLTNVLNRRGLQQFLSVESDRAGRTGSDLVVVLVDLDDFKRINDSLGHAVGDTVLKDIAQRLKSTLRPSDQVSRIGRDEFLLVLPETRFAEGLEVAERVRLALSTSVLELGSKQVSVTASLGVAAVPSESAYLIDELLHRTAMALQRSKQAGKNRVSYSGKTVGDGADGETELSDFIEMIRKGLGFRAVAQPIISLPDESTTGYEILARGPKGPFEMPNHFFRVAYENGILTLVDRSCLEVCSKALGILDPQAQFHLNLFPSTLGRHPDRTPDRGVDGPKQQRQPVCRDQRAVRGVPQGLLLIEPLSALREKGITVVIDDVGFGRSCLESLIILEPEIVKIDGKYVRGIAQSQSKVRSLKRLLTVIDSLGANAVAEEIENREDLELLLDLGVEYGQGFLWDRPRPAEEFNPPAPHPAGPVDLLNP